MSSPELCHLQWYARADEYKAPGNAAPITVQCFHQLYKCPQSRLQMFLQFAVMLTFILTDVCTASQVVGACSSFLALIFLRTWIIILATTTLLYNICVYGLLTSMFGSCPVFTANFAVMEVGDTRDPNMQYAFGLHLEVKRKE